jgi:hypothetical protein
MDRGACFAALGITEDAGYDEAHDAFRRLACTTHPDLGGDAARFALVHAAWRAIAPTLTRRPRLVVAPVVAPDRTADPVVSAAAPTVVGVDPRLRRARASYASAVALPPTQPLAPRRHRTIRPEPVVAVDPAFADLLDAALAAA